MSIRLAGICCLCLACLLHWSPSRAEFVLSAAEAPLEVHCINVACADCILIRQGDHTLMVDSGNLGEADRIVRYLELRPHPGIPGSAARGGRRHLFAPGPV